MTERNFYGERIAAQIAELRRRHTGDDATFMIELAKFWVTNARNKTEASEAREMLAAVKALWKMEH